MDLYMKNAAGEFVPISIECVVDPKEWSGKLVVMKVGSAERPATEADEDDFAKALESSDAIMNNAVDTSILVGRHSVTFEIRGERNE